MSHEIICAWLGLPPDGWPPDHYRLLGLRAGEDDVALIEQRVHQRLDSVRRYQMMHPDQATEAMNRLAQAFVCLTDPAAKSAYDLHLLGPLGPKAPRPAPAPAPAPSAPPVSAPAPPTPLPAARPDPLSWLSAPPPVRATDATRALPPPLSPQLATATSPPPLPPARPQVPPPLPTSRPQPGPASAASEPAELPELEPASVPVPVPASAPGTVPPPKPIDALREAAQKSPGATQGLSTKRALYHRLVRTRRLLASWRRLGDYLDNPQPDEPLSKQQASEVLKALKQIETLMEDFPPPLGEVGQGYMIVNLNQGDNARARIQALSVAQRESLQRDWQAGLRFLTLHREMLRGQTAEMRKRNLFTHALMAGRAFLNEHALSTLIVAGAVLAVAFALLRTFWRAFG